MSRLYVEAIDLDNGVEANSGNNNQAVVFNFKKRKEAEREEKSNCNSEDILDLEIRLHNTTKNLEESYDVIKKMEREIDLFKLFT